MNVFGMYMHVDSSAVLWLMLILFLLLSVLLCRRRGRISSGKGHREFEPVPVKCHDEKPCNSDFRWKVSSCYFPFVFIILIADCRLVVDSTADACLFGSIEAFQHFLKVDVCFLVCFSDYFLKPARGMELAWLCSNCWLVINVVDWCWLIRLRLALLG